MSWIITGGLGSKKIVTGGYFAGLAENIIRDIVRVTSKIIRSVSVTSEVIKVVNLKSKTDLEQD